jgi:hypothetical protein
MSDENYARDFLATLSDEDIEKVNTMQSIKTAHESWFFFVDRVYKQYFKCIISMLSCIGYYCFISLNVLTELDQVKHQNNGKQPFVVFLFFSNQKNNSLNSSPPYLVFPSRR